VDQLLVGGLLAGPGIEGARATSHEARRWEFMDAGVAVAELLPVIAVEPA
jgi:hypothetical protein